MPDAFIHPSALVSPEAKIGMGVSIGPFCIVGAEVSIGEGSSLHSHVVIDGYVEIGKNNQFFPFCSIGAPPQDISYRGEPTKAVIGEGNIFREYVSVHRGTTKENRVTFIGNQSFFMSGVHLAHDTVVKDRCIFASGVLLGGHVKIESDTFVGGMTCFKPFVRVGRGVYIGGGSVIDRDIPSFGTGYGNRMQLSGINIVALRKHGYTKEQISQAIRFYKKLESSEDSAYIVAEKLLGSDQTQCDLIKEICQSIVIGKCGVTPFRKNK